jgi:glycosyltransferase involved in cell wall biosynthesis
MQISTLSATSFSTSDRPATFMLIALCADGRSPHGQRWANGVVERGHELCFVWAADEFDGADISGFDASISHYVVPAHDYARPWLVPMASTSVRLLGRRLRPDLAHGFYLSGHGWNAHSLGVRPLVLSALGSDVADLRWRISGPVYKRVAHAYAAVRTSLAVKAADVVLADSTVLAKEVRKLVPGAQTRIIRFGVETKLPPSSARQKWRRRLDAADDAFVLLSTRLLRPNYNIETIIRALPEILRRVPTTVLVLKEVPRFSDPDYRRHCLELAGRLGVREAVRVVGELPRGELLELYVASDVFVSVPTTDGTSVSVFEAMAAGVAVVASRAPGVDPAILGHAETALLVDVQDSASLAAAVSMLALDDKLRGTLVDQARETARRYGDFDRELDRAVLLYEELVAARRSAA